VSSLILYGYHSLTEIGFFDNIVNLTGINNNSKELEQMVRNNKKVLTSEKLSVSKNYKWHKNKKSS